MSEHPPGRGSGVAAEAVVSCVPGVQGAFRPRDPPLTRNPRSGTFVPFPASLRRHPMQLFPSFEEFQALARSAGPAVLVPVWREFLFDVDTAVTAYAKLAEPPVRLPARVRGGRRAVGPLQLPGHAARRAPGGSRTGRCRWWTPEQGWKDVATDDPLGDLDARLRARKPAEVPRAAPPVGRGGRLLRVRRRPPDRAAAAARRIDDLGLPDGLFLFTDVVLAIDNLQGPRDGDRGRAGRARRCDEAELRRAYDDAARAHRRGRSSASRRSRPRAARAQARARRATRRSRRAARARQFEAGGRDASGVHPRGRRLPGRALQRLGMDLRASPFDLYRALRSLNPSPYLYFLELDGLTLVGSLARGARPRSRTAWSRCARSPGTRRRGKTPEEDRALAADLLADEKELAEHRMLVDLGRNDVGRVAEYGSVHVPDLMVVERYSHVMHLVSQVEGKLKRGAVRDGRVPRVLPRGHGLGRAQDPRDGDHRRARAGAARHVRGRGRPLRVRRREHGHRDHDPHRASSPAGAPTCRRARGSCATRIPRPNTRSR